MANKAAIPRPPLPQELLDHRHGGHNLRTGREVVDRSRLGQIPVRVEPGADRQPNQFAGPTYRNDRTRYRLDGHKMLYHLDRVLAWQRGERIAPVHIDMGLTKFCNTACTYCYGVTQGMTKGVLIEREALLRFVEDCGRLAVRSIGFIGDGEPTLNPAVYDAAVLAKTRGVDTGMATNGLLLDMERAEDLLRDMTFIRFNLSAADPEGFRRVHQSHPRNFPLLLDKIRELVRLKRQHGLPCTLGIQMVLIPENFHQILPMAELGAGLGVDYLQLKQCSDTEYGEIGVDYADYGRVTEDLRRAEALSRDDYQVSAKWNKLQITGETELYRGGFRKYDVCLGTPFLGQISGNGRVYPCGPFFGKERFFMGDIHEQSYYDIVTGDRYWEVQRDVREHVDVHHDCTIGCRQDYLNKFLWDLDTPPEHLNFI